MRRTHKHIKLQVLQHFITRKQTRLIFFLIEEKAFSFIRRNDIRLKSWHGLIKLGYTTIEKTYKMNIQLDLISTEY